MTEKDTEEGAIQTDSEPADEAPILEKGEAEPDAPVSAKPASGDKDEGGAGDRSKPVSQAVQDLADLDEGQLKELKDRKDEKGGSGSSLKDHVWMFLLVLSEIFLIFWIIGTFLDNRPYRGLSVPLVALAMLVSFPVPKWIRVPTKAAVAFLGVAMAFLVTSLHDPNVHIIPALHISLVWALALAALWVTVLVAVLRIFIYKGRKASTVMIVLLLYTAVGLVSALGGYFGGSAAEGFTFSYLNNSPVGLTDSLPWFIEPAMFFNVLLPLAAALVFFRYEIRVLSDPAVATKHHAGLFLGLGCVILALAGFMFNLTTGDHLPGLASSIREIPEGTLWKKGESAPAVPAAHRAVPAAPAASEAAPPTPVAPPAALEAAPSGPETVPSTPETTPAAPEAVPSVAAPVAPDSAPAVTETVPAAPDAVPSAPEAVPAAPAVVPPTPEATPAAPGAVPFVAAPAAPEAAPAVSEAIPAAPEAAPAVSETVPAAPEAAPAVSETVPAAPEAAPAVPVALEAVPTAPVAAPLASAAPEAAPEASPPGHMAVPSASGAPEAASAAPVDIPPASGASEAVPVAPVPSPVATEPGPALPRGLPLIQPGASLGPDTIVYPYDKESAPSPYYFPETVADPGQQAPAVSGGEAPDSLNSMIGTPAAEGAGLPLESPTTPDAAVAYPPSDVTDISGSPPVAGADLASVFNPSPPAELDDLKRENETLRFRLVEQEDRLALLEARIQSIERILGHAAASAVAAGTGASPQGIAAQ
jgi:hypothetical protein